MTSSDPPLGDTLEIPLRGQSDAPGLRLSPIADFHVCGSMVCYLEGSQSERGSQGRVEKVERRPRMRGCCGVGAGHPPGTKMIFFLQGSSAASVGATTESQVHKGMCLTLPTRHLRLYLLTLPCSDSLDCGP